MKNQILLEKFTPSNSQAYPFYKMENSYNKDNAERIRHRRREQIFGVDALLKAIEYPATKETTIALKNAVWALCSESEQAKLGDTSIRTLNFDNIQFSPEPFKETITVDALMGEDIDRSETPEIEALFLTYHPEIQVGEFSLALPSRIKVSREYGVTIDGIEGLIDGPGIVHETISTDRVKGELIIERSISEFTHVGEDWIEEMGTIRVARFLSENEAQIYLNALVEAVGQDARIQEAKGEI